MSEKQQKVLKWREHMIFRHFEYVKEQILASQERNSSNSKSKEVVVNITSGLEYDNDDDDSYGIGEDSNISCWSLMSSDETEPEVAVPTPPPVSTSRTSDEIAVAMALASRFGNNIPRASTPYPERQGTPTSIVSVSSNGTFSRNFPTTSEDSNSSSGVTILKVPCQYCDLTFPDCGLLDDHIIGSHCPVLFSEYKHSSLNSLQFELALDRFFSQYINLFKTKCHFCDFRVSKTERFQLRRHLVKVHLEELRLELVKYQRKCLPQLEKIISPGDTIRQSFTPDPDPENSQYCICTLCGKQIMNKYNCRLNHLRAMHGYEMIKCNFCEETFGLMDGKRRHELRVHCHLLFQDRNTKGLQKEEFIRLVFETLDDILGFNDNTPKKNRCPLCPSYTLHGRAEMTKAKWRVHLVSMHHDYVSKEITAYQKRRDAGGKVAVGRKEDAMVEVFDVDNDVDDDDYYEDDDGIVEGGNFLKVKCHECGQKFTYSELAEHEAYGLCGTPSIASEVIGEGEDETPSFHEAFKSNGSFHESTSGLSSTPKPTSSFKTTRKPSVVDTPVAQEFLEAFKCNGSSQHRQSTSGLSSTPTPTSSLQAKRKSSVVDASVAPVPLSPEKETGFQKISRDTENPEIFPYPRNAFRDGRMVNFSGPWKRQKIDATNNSAAVGEVAPTSTAIGRIQKGLPATSTSGLSSIPTFTLTAKRISSVQGGSISLGSPEQKRQRVDVANNSPGVAVGGVASTSGAMNQIQSASRVRSSFFQDGNTRIVIKSTNGGPVFISRVKVTEEDKSHSTYPAVEEMSTKILSSYSISSISSRRN